MRNSEDPDLGAFEIGVLETLRKDLVYRTINGDANAERELHRLNRKIAKLEKITKAEK